LLLHPEGVTVAIPVEDLDPVTSAVAKDEEVSRERVLGDPLANELGETVERGIFLIPLAVKTVRTGRS
jgi:hypothetical protein